MKEWKRTWKLFSWVIYGLLQRSIPSMNFSCGVECNVLGLYKVQDIVVGLGSPLFQKPDKQTRR